MKAILRMRGPGRLRGSDPNIVGSEWAADGPPPEIHDVSRSRDTFRSEHPEGPITRLPSSGALRPKQFPATRCGRAEGGVYAVRRRLKIA